jgi:hypothetical protein
MLLLGGFGAGLGILRSHGGDVIAAAWLCYVIRASVCVPAWAVASTVLSAGCMLEIAQYVGVMSRWHQSGAFLSIAVGGTADWLDLVAYAIGATAAWAGRNGDNV